MAEAFPTAKKKQSGSESWISVSDLMSGLMLVFMAIAIFFMLQIQEEKAVLQVTKENMEKIATVYDRVRIDLYEDLEEEFKDDLVEWGAEIDPATLSIRFNEPEVLFRPGEARLQTKFTTILDEFFPRYVAVLMRDEYRDHITEVRIEGHTSSDWFGLPERSAYRQNMGLSQSRTREVLAYVMELPGVENEWDGWLRERVTANGLSSSRLILIDGQEDSERSRRVEFRVRTDAEELLNQILEEIKASRGPAEKEATP